MTNPKRLGRYHSLTTNNNNSSNNNNNNGYSNSTSYFKELESLYKENSLRSLLDWDKPIFGHRYTTLHKVLANANKVIEKSTKFMNKIKSRQLACANRVKSIPENATLREEYIKCGKGICEAPHGPYFYAYWKDHQSKKLKKKYIGSHLPDDKEQSKGRIQNNQEI